MAIDSESRLIVSDMVGGGDGEYTNGFMDDPGSRLANRVPLAKDGDK